MRGSTQKQRKRIQGPDTWPDIKSEEEKNIKHYVDG